MDLKSIKDNLPNCADMVEDIEKELGLDENSVLTEDQIDSICKILSENSPESMKNMPKIPTNALEVPDEKYLKMMEELDSMPQEASMAVDPITGLANILPKVENVYNEIKFADIDKANDMLVYSQSSLDSLSKSYEMTEEECSVLLHALVDNSYLDNPYGVCPKSIKEVIDGISFADNTNQNAITILNMLKGTLLQEQAVVDLEKSLEMEFSNFDEATKDIDIAGIYMDKVRHSMEVELEEKATELESTNIKKARRLRDSIKSFKSSYTYDFIEEYVNKRRVPIKVKGKKLSLQKELDYLLKQYAGVTSAFNAKYINSKFTIDDISKVPAILNRHINDDRFGIDDYMKFTILICKSFAVLKATNIVNHTLMYYTVKNIIMLDYIKNRDSEFNKELKNNIISMIEKMNEYV